MINVKGIKVYEIFENWEKIFQKFLKAVYIPN